MPQVVPTLTLPRPQREQEPAPPHPPAPRRGRIAALDGLRLLAALMVVAYHYLAWRGSWPAPTEITFPTAFPFAVYGWLGVELFFLISGFVICMSCWGRSLGDFFVSRVSRLYPAYWLAVLTTSAVLLLVPGGWDPHPWPDILINLTMLNEPLGVRSVDAVYWTLFAELRFYLLFAIVAWRGLTYRRVVVFCCVWAVAGLAFHKTGDEALRVMIMPTFCWYFIAGMAFYLMYRFRPTPLLTGIVLVCFGASVSSARLVWRNTLDHFDRQIPFWPVALILVACFALMALVATGRLSWMNWRWLGYAGATTYPLYLLHEKIGWEIIGVLAPYVPGYLLVGLLTACMLVAAYLVHRLVEKPVSGWLKHRLNRAVAESARQREDASQRTPTH
ncbi:acyltransferase family protein [Streptomyces sp. NPDC127084]|uniref:acyltransferase family protein n=1 Tax=Streptomyces sp. NPDC127084 TaxID=3347133 RepID=UPI00364E8BDA